MANVTKKRVRDFIATLNDMGGSSGNGYLRSQLGWNEDVYWTVQGHLIEEGRLVAGRGRGGSVRLAESELSAETSATIDEPKLPTSAAILKRERALYAPLSKSIEGRWINRFGYDESYVAETHSRGSKDTGGTFTRPDITAVGVRRYVYLPKRLEVVTFEIKPAEVISVVAILEAIAHREASHRSYAIYAASREKFEGSSEAVRIVELAQKHGIGILLTENSSDVETWEIIIDAIRHEPDPARLDRFLSDLPSEEMKKQLSKWKE